MRHPGRGAVFNQRGRRSHGQFVELHAAAYDAVFTAPWLQARRGAGHAAGAQAGVCSQEYARCQNCLQVVVVSLERPIGAENGPVSSGQTSQKGKRRTNQAKLHCRGLKEAVCRQCARRVASKRQRTGFDAVAERSGGKRYGAGEVSPTDIPFKSKIQPLNANPDPHDPCCETHATSAWALPVVCKGSLSKT